jgi:hypothetical protein
LPDEIKWKVMPRLTELITPVTKSTRIAIQLTRLNLLAVVESISVRFIAGSNFLRDGTSTSEIKNIPPSQTMAARTCISRTRKGVIFKFDFLEYVAVPRCRKILAAQILLKKTTKGNRLLEYS